MIPALIPKIGALGVRRTSIRAIPSASLQKEWLYPPFEEG